MKSPRLASFDCTLPSLVFDRQSAPEVCSPEAAAGLFWPLLHDLERERFAVAATDRRNKVIEAAVLSVGGSAFTVVDTVLILRWAITRSRAASGVIVAHNHPSGDPLPSITDIEATRRLKGAAEVVGLKLHDHVVMAGLEFYVSMASTGDM